MKYSTSRDKLSQMHEALDRQLEMAGHPPLTKSKRQRDQFRYISDQDEHKKSTLTNISNKPTVYEHEIREIDIKTKKNQIGELERKLMELQKKMDNFSVSSDDQVEKIKVSTKEKLSFKSKIDTRPNEDTARFLVKQQKQRVNTKSLADYPAFADEQEEEEDSEEYFQVRQAIIKRKAQQRRPNQRQSVQKFRQKIPVRLSRGDSLSKKIDGQQTDRKISVQTQSVLRPKYSNERSNRSNKNQHKKSVSKGSIRQSMVSKKSVQKQKKLQRNGSKGSLRSNQSKKHTNKIQQRNNDRSFNRSEGPDDFGLREEEILLTKQMKKANNLQKQLQHYKRLTKKLKQEVQGYKVMEIEFRELKKNFAKSEAIRAQQKKIIQTLKAKIGR